MVTDEEVGDLAARGQLRNWRIHLKESYDTVKLNF